MQNKLNQNQIERVGRKYHDHPLFIACNRAFGHYEAEMQRLLFAPEEIFLEAAIILDDILTEPEGADRRAADLWNSLKRKIRYWDNAAPQEDLNKITGAILCVVAATLGLHLHPFFNFDVMDIILTQVQKNMNVPEEERIRYILELSRCAEGLDSWLYKYAESEDLLSEEIMETAKYARSGRSDLSNNTNAASLASLASSNPAIRAAKNASDKPQTLAYYKHGKNNILKEQHKRVHIVFRKWNEWGWIDDDTTFEDFGAFFEGHPRYCNIEWKANTTILTILLQELLKQDFIQKQTGLSAKSLVKDQFSRSPSWDRNRLDSDSWEKINISLYVINIQNPLPPRHSSEDLNDFDASDAALAAISSGLLHLTKSV